MSKKKIFSTSLIVLGMGLFLAGPVFANGLVVEFEKTPLFDEANFLPGQSVTRLVRVTNNSGQTERIATEAINISDPHGLGNALTLEIKEGGARLYNGPLSQFFNAGEVYLSDLDGNGIQTQYDFIVTFYPGANNTFQDKTLGFDILIGFQGTEGGLTPGGGGGFLPPGLTITNETTEEIGENFVIITWQTNYFSTSQVVYGAKGEDHTLDLTDNTGTPPKYGYAYTTPESDVSPKVTVHEVVITGLTPGTAYYYRCISHASLAVSTEHSFTTLGVGIGEQEEEEEPAYVPLSGTSVGKEEAVPPEAPSGSEERRGEEELLGVPEINEISQTEQEKPGLSWLLAGIGELFKGLKNLWWLWLLIIILILSYKLLSYLRHKSSSQ